MILHPKKIFTARFTSVTSLHAAKRSKIPAGIVFLLLGAGLLRAQVSVLTYHNDTARTAQNLAETTLTPAALASRSFARLFNHSVDGLVYAQPLLVPGVYVPGKGPHNVVYVATEHDSVFAFDADNTNGANAKPLWQVSFLDPAQGVTTVPADSLGCEQTGPELGVTGTPVIDPASGTLYVVATTLENGAYFHRLHALDIAGGSERPGSPVEVQASVPGTGEGSDTVVFDPQSYKQRPALLLLNGVVYTSFSSHCDEGIYHGWMIGYDASTLKQVSVYNNTPNGNQGSFWQSGAGPAADAQGNIYVVAGNGTFDGDNGGPDLGESFIRLSTANGLAATDYFTPYNQASLNGLDLDTGSSGPLLLPDSAGSAAHPHLLVSAGKEGRIYLLDRDSMGHFKGDGDSQIPQALLNVIGPLYGAAAYFNGAVYFSGVQDNLKSFSVHDGLLSEIPLSQTTAVFPNPGSVPVISANGNQGGIVWAVESSATGTLHAFDAADLSRELYNSNRLAADVLPSYVKFSTPMVANGKVYTGTKGSLAAFGFTQPAQTRSLGIANAATFTSGPAAPGAIVSLFGAFGFPTASPGTGPLPLLLAGASVHIGGILAPLLYVGPTQINAVVPFETPLGANTVVVSSGGADLISNVVTVQASQPALFMTAPGQAAVINQDGTVNGPAHPAAPGSTVSAYLTGLGAVSPAVPSGALAAAAPLAQVSGAVTARVGSADAQVVAAVLSPGYAGLYQVNLVLPSGSTGTLTLTINVAGVTSNTAAISIR